MLEDIISLIPGQELSADDIQKLEHRFKEKAFKAIDVVANHSIEQLYFVPSGREIWAVPGREKIHLVLRNTYCDCLDFYLNVVIKGKNECCYHLLAVEIANKLGKFKQAILQDSTYRRSKNKFK
jgi:predicted nucleic acid-binding Zn finger protein